MSDVVIPTRCIHCGGTLDHRKAGSVYCHELHKHKGRRRIKAGLPPNAYPEGARRGRVPLGQLTSAEMRLQFMRRVA